MLTTLTRTIGAIVAALLFVAPAPVMPPVIAHEVGNSEIVSGDILVGVSDDAERLVLDTGVEQPLTYKISETPTEPFDANDMMDPCAIKSCSPYDSIARQSRHRFWVVSSRGLTWNACAADLDAPLMTVSRLYCNGMTQRSSMTEFQSELQPGRRVVYYVHGNRTSSINAIRYGLTFFNRVKAYLDDQPTEWVIFNWPSAQTGVLLKDAREKAARTDAEGLYLAWLLRHHVEQSSPIAMVGYSFGARVLSGSIHALAGGPLANRTLPAPHYCGADISVGFVAAAFDADWLMEGHYHGCSTKNMRTLTMLYNQRDVALRNHWRLTRERSSEALGFSGPRCFGARCDGTALPVRALNCTSSVRARHAERFYYDRACSAGLQMATLINQAKPASNLQITIKTNGTTGQF
ncbi:MAG: hypothetical protein WBD20_08100 [Pirellulaceae bacterium]